MEIHYLTQRELAERWRIGEAWCYPLRLIDKESRSTV